MVSLIENQILAMRQTLFTKVNWYTINKKEGGPHCYESGPLNPYCKVQNKFCSVALGAPGDICYWHWCRMGSVEILRCGCKLWETVSGDSVAQILTSRYYQKETF